MTDTEVPALNAKERRKLQRQQKQAADASIEVTMNAKERRKLLRQQQQAETENESDVKEEPAATKPETPVKKTQVVAKQATDKPIVPAAPPMERLNAKERRMQQRQAQRGDKPTLAAEAQKSKKRKRKAKDDGEDGNSTYKKRIHLTLFVGQLPFTATEDKIRKHFAEAGAIQLRMMTDKKTGKFRGTAFIEVKDSKALGAALSRHHTLLDGRRINVELTASGGGNNSTQRREKIDGLRKKQSEKQIEKTRALVQKHIAMPESKLKEQDVDDRMIDYLSWFDYSTAKFALDEYSRSVSDRVNNRKAFFMGILKRFRQTDGVE